ncbi:CLUMA_CG005449, isoform A [Clunio marinus]|uniref:CLUMA_CG005449, isoform A n=1 Tax=Clunio marinus TaxID=568069 RepID=A0A1J1HUS6_9DIPT|nr:CLUMA_CG005449, isoform A [Clunio marinus]
MRTFSENILFLTLMLDFEHFSVITVMLPLKKLKLLNYYPRLITKLGILAVTEYKALKLWKNSRKAFN